MTPKPDAIDVSATVSASLFKPGFKLMSGQQASAHQTPNLPEIEVLVSTKKLSIKPSNQLLPVKPKVAP
ncbi:hypothetical protein N9V90_00350 [Endozoicomonas sp.]|nr:hypothetical protein [Endozoicomonas sp.]